MAEQLNPEEVTLNSEIEPKNNISQNETHDITDLNEYFNDSLHIEDVGNIADDNAIWVYFGVGGPA